jgi:hypothetical protein
MNHASDSQDDLQSAGQAFLNKRLIASSSLGTIKGPIFYRLPRIFTILALIIYACRSILTQDEFSVGNYFPISVKENIYI